MQTLKLNSTGDAVRLLQRLLGIKDDGKFGKQTEQTLKTFQSQHNLTPDGICGPQTWAALGVTDTKLQPAHLFLDTKYDPLKRYFTHLSNRTVRYIAIHYTAGRSSAFGSAEKTRRGWDTAGVSADFVVDDHTILQCNPDPHHNYCWAVGGSKNPYSGGGSLHGKATNSNTVSVEICSNLRADASPHAANHAGWSFTEASLNNARRLVRMLMKHFNIPADRVVRHYDISGKLCPGIPGWNDAPLYNPDGTKTKQHSDSKEWQKFLKSL